MSLDGDKTPHEILRESFEKLERMERRLGVKAPRQKVRRIEPEMGMVPVREVAYDPSLTIEEWLAMEMDYYSVLR